MAEIPEFDLDSDELRDSERKKEADKKRAELRLAFVRLMESPEGALVLRKILEATHLYALSYVKGDAMETARREGERNVGLRVLAMMGDADSGLAFDVLREIKKE